MQGLFMSTLTVLFKGIYWVSCSTAGPDIAFC